MSEFIKHECGVVLIRLRKPRSYYKNSNYGLQILYQMMEKMRNRGQDGAGMASIKLHPQPGVPYLYRHRSVANQAIQDIFDHIYNSQHQHQLLQLNEDDLPYSGELLLGHLRYGTFGKNGIESCHPFKRSNNWLSRSLVLAGNFNLTNVDELFQQLVELGQHPVERADTVTVLEKIGHFLDRENDRLFKHFKDQKLTNEAISVQIQTHLDLASVLQESSKKWDGGFVMSGLIGHGDAFVFRDAHGIRPAYYYIDEDIIVAASERPVIQTVLNVSQDTIHELPPGQALIIKKDGTFKCEVILPAAERQACSFERIYFSRGNDTDIYQERKALGRHLAHQVWDAVKHQLQNTVFSFIPNTAELAFYGMVQELEKLAHQQHSEARIRVEKLIYKDAKLRTFITDQAQRDDLVNLVYDITYGVVKPHQDTVVVMDDSIVRGTTLKRSILRIIDRLQPKKIIIVSSAPQIRYPDCYGIDMAELSRFIAFEAAIALTRERGQAKTLDHLHQLAQLELLKPKTEQINIVQALYAPFNDAEISNKIAELVKPKELQAELEIIYQTIPGLHASCPNHTGDWYFSGCYPTPGGTKVCNQAFVNFMEGKGGRAY